MYIKQRGKCLRLPTLCIVVLKNRSKLEVHLHYHKVRRFGGDQWPGTTASSDARCNWGRGRSQNTFWPLAGNWSHYAFMVMTVSASDDNAPGCLAMFGAPPKDDELVRKTISQKIFETHDAKLSPRRVTNSSSRKMCRTRSSLLDTHVDAHQSHTSAARSQSGDAHQLDQDGQRTGCS